MAMSSAQADAPEHANRDKLNEWFPRETVVTERPNEQEFIGIFNDVLGPIMRGPSSSHTAGSHRIGCLARSLLGDCPAAVTFTFAPGSSIAQTYRPQGVDLALAAGLLGQSMTDPAFFESLKRARALGMDIGFEVAPIPRADHPNFMSIELRGPQDGVLRLDAKSTGGGGVEITHLQGWPLRITGKTHDYACICDRACQDSIQQRLMLLDGGRRPPVVREKGTQALIHFQRSQALAPAALNELKAARGVHAVHVSDPVFYVQQGEPLFLSGQGACALGCERSVSLGTLGREYESTLLSMSAAEVRHDMLDRFAVMQTSCSDGFQDDRVNMLLLAPTAGRIQKAQSEKKLAIGGLHTRAAARAMAVMHTCNSRGIVCAAPTGGSAGVVPAVVITLAEEFNLAPEDIVQLLFAAGATGLIVARRSGFAAEVAGCQVEIGAAGAMAAAAVVEFAGGTAQQAADAAAVALQNTMGLTCDPVQGTCEIPCHTRNAVAASSAFVCADLVLGGYTNPISLDETVDASLSVGKMLPCELRCTAKGGIALAPSALKMNSRR